MGAAGREAPAAFGTARLVEELRVVYDDLLAP
jgi:hypothetical protein